MEFSPEASEETVREYATSLFGCGVDFIEVNRHSFPFLKGVNTSLHYIFRIESPADLKLVQGESFAFVAIPAELLYLAPYTLHPVIAEINLDGKPLHKALSPVLNSRELDFVSMIRFTGDFSERIPELFNFVKLFKNKAMFSIDFCPLDTSMGGVVSAIWMHRAGADALTMSFGEKGDYTALEKYIIVSSSMYGDDPAQDYLSGICLAALNFSRISALRFNGMRNINDTFPMIPPRAFNIDVPKEEKRSFRLETNKNPYSDNTVEDRFCEALELDGKFSDDLKKAMEAFNIGLGKTKSIKPKSKILPQ